jgi:tight adherence protein C
MELLAASLAAVAAMMAALAARLLAEPAVLNRLGPRLRARREVPVRSILRKLAPTWIVRRIPGRERLEHRLSLSGWSVVLAEVVGVKVLAAAVAAALALLAPRPGALLAPVIILASFQTPDLAVAWAARRQTRRADQELPLLLDLLAAASSAGLSGQLALRRAVSAVGGPLAAELGRTLDAVDLGARWRDELRATVDRLALPDLRRAVTALTRTESYGSSLAAQMSMLAAQAREARRAAVTERARKAPVKMLFPLVFLVLPAFLLLTVVPVLLTTLKSIA